MEGKAARNQVGEELQQMRYSTCKIYQILCTQGKLEAWKGGGKTVKNQVGEELQQMRYSTCKIYQILCTQGKLEAWKGGGGKAARNQVGKNCRKWVILPVKSTRSNVHKVS